MVGRNEKGEEREGEMIGGAMEKGVRRGEGERIIQGTELEGEKHQYREIYGKASERNSYRGRRKRVT